jgi:type I restriction enzyme M protein
MVDRKHRELTAEDTERISGAYHAWRGEPGAGVYEDVPGICSSATKEQIAEQRFVLTPGRYVGSANVEDDGEPLPEKIQRLKSELIEAFAESDKLQGQVLEAMRQLDG